MGRLRRLFDHSVLFAVNALATKLISFLLVPIYTACMSAGEYGIADMSLTVISLVSSIFTLSISDAVVRFIVDDRGRTSEYVFVSAVVTLVSVIFAGLFVPLLDLEVFGGLGDYRVLFIGAYFTSVTYSVCGNCARGMDRVKIIPLCAGASSLATLISTIYFVGFMKLQLEGYFISVIAGQTIGIFLYVFFGGLGVAAIEGMTRLLRSEQSFQRFLKLCVQMFKYSVPLIPNSIFWWAQTSISRVFLTGYLGISSSGMYAAAAKIPSILNVLYSVFQQAWQLSAFEESKNDDIGSFYSTIFKVLQVFLILSCSIMTLAAPLLASWFLQGDTFSAWTMIPVMLISNVINILNTFFGTVYTTTLHTSYIMKTTCAGALICVILTPPMILGIGTPGACVASVVSQTTVLIMRAIDSRKYIHFDAKWNTLIPSLLILLLQALISLIRPPYWGLISICCLVLAFLVQRVNIPTLRLRRT